MRCASGEALLGHPFIRLAFLQPWRAVPRPQDVDEVMAELRQRLDELAERTGEVSLVVPFACFDANRLP